MYNPTNLFRPEMCIGFFNFRPTFFRFKYSDGFFRLGWSALVTFRERVSYVYLEFAVSFGHRYSFFVHLADVRFSRYRPPLPMNNSAF